MKRSFMMALIILGLCCSCYRKKGSSVDIVAPAEELTSVEGINADGDWVMCFSAKDMRQDGCPWDDSSYVVIGGYMTIDTCGIVKGYTVGDNYSSRIKLDSAGILHAHRTSFLEEEKQYSIGSIFDLYLYGIIEDNPELEGLITYHSVPNERDADIQYSYPYGTSTLNGTFYKLDEDTYISIDTYDMGRGTIVDKVYYKRVKGFLEE